MLPHNVGRFDRVARTVAAFSLFLLYAWVDFPVAWIAAVIGVVLLFTALSGSCPLYMWEGTSTVEADEIP